jgi:CRP/FNR family transcriptional regulator
MTVLSVQPIVVGRGPADPCAHCETRPASVCSAIPDADLARLAAAAAPRAYERGELFIEEGEPAQDFFNVTRGTAKLFKLLPDGRQQVIGFAQAGHFLGLAVSQSYAFSAQAIEPMRACRFSRATLQRLVDDFPALERRLLATACNELVTAQEQILMLGRKTAQERVASFLINWRDNATLCGRAPAALHLPMTRGEVADYLGLTIETVSRTFSRFRADGRITTPSHSEVVLLDLRWLRDMAAGTGADPGLRRL